MADWRPLAEVVALPTEPPPVRASAPEPPAARPVRPTPKKRLVPPVYRMVGQTEFLEVFPDRLTITPKGGQGSPDPRLAGHPRDQPPPAAGHRLQAAGVHQRLPAIHRGGRRGRLGRTLTDTNTFRFVKSSENIDAAGRITSYVQERMQAARVLPSASAAAPVSLSDELGKLAALRDQGVLTDAEFQAAKQRLLT